MLISRQRLTAKMLISLKKQAKCSFHAVSEAQKRLFQF